MARIVQTIVKVNRAMSLVNVLESGVSEEYTFFEDDMVDDLKYVEDFQVKSVSGRIGKIGFRMPSTVKIPRKGVIDVESTFSQDVKVSTVSVDHSTEYHANVTDVIGKEIIEYHTDEEVQKVKIYPFITVDLKVLLTDNTSSEITLQEGMNLYNVTINRKGASFTGDYKLESFIYESTDNFTDLIVTGMYLSSGSLIYKVNMMDIKVVGNGAIIIDEDESITDVLSKIASGEITSPEVELPVAVYSEPLTFANNVELIGANADVSAVSPERCKDEVEGETELISLLSCEPGSDVIINGITMSKEANFKINGAKSIKFKNCRFVDMTPEKAKSFLLLDNFNDESEGVLLQIEDCYFGNNGQTDVGKTYNLFELNCKLADGSYIKNCYFAKDCCTNNIIALYDVMDGATINIVNNHFEMAANAVRIGFVGEANCVVNVKDNVYDATDDNPEWAGFLIVQPYGSRTTSMAGVTVNMENNVYTGEGETRDYYLYCNETDPQFTDETMPVINVL